MDTPRLQRRTLILLAAAAGLPAAQAQDRFPTRPVRLVVPYATGGVGDIFARLVAAQLTEILGQQVLVENPAGGDAIPGTAAAARAPADGYTFMQLTTGQTVNTVLREKVPYDILRDFTPLARAAITPLVLTVPATSPARTVAELTALAKARGGFPYGTGGIGSVGHLSCELYRRSVGIDGIHVPYKGNGPLMPDLIGGRLGWAFLSVVDAGQHVTAGRLRALAVTASQRLPTLPEVPTLAESGISAPVMAFSYGYVAPRGTPEPIVRQLSEAILKALAVPAVQERARALGSSLIPGGPAEMTELIKGELAQWGQVIRDANIKAE